MGPCAHGVRLCLEGSCPWLMFWFHCLKSLTTFWQDNSHFESHLFQPYPVWCQLCGEHPEFGVKIWVKCCVHQCSKHKLPFSRLREKKNQNMHTALSLLMVKGTQTAELVYHACNPNTWKAEAGGLWEFKSAGWHSSRPVRATEGDPVSKQHTITLHSTIQNQTEYNTRRIQENIEDDSQ